MVETEPDSTRVTVSTKQLKALLKERNELKKRAVAAETALAELQVWCEQCMGGEAPSPPKDTHS